MKQTSAIKGHIKRRTSNEAFNEISFPHGLLEIHNYTLKVITTTNVKKKIVIEIHKYKGFSLIKFYPFHLKKDKKRYEYRGEKQLGYSLSSRTVFYIIHECILVMRDYLEENPHEFVGYIGQVDSKDNSRKREQSQRTSIYNRITSSIFEDGTMYKISSKKIFKEINLRLIRKIISKQENKLTKQQMENYNFFLNEFKKSPHILYTLMTARTKIKVLENI